MTATTSPVIGTPEISTLPTGLPSAGTWVIDPAHSHVGFVVRHLVAAKARGRFGEFAGDIQVADRPEDSSVVVEIDAASIDTGQPDRDTHLRASDFFDVEQFPTIRFRSTAVRPVGDRRFDIAGELTVRGVTKPVTLELELGGVVRDPFGNDTAIFSAETELDREEFGLTYNQALETGGVLIGKKAKIELEIEATKQ
jgi:polyisoprenoid-binding protein YceI